MSFVSLLFWHSPCQNDQEITYESFNSQDRDPKRYNNYKCKQSQNIIVTLTLFFWYWSEVSTLFGSTNFSPYLVIITSPEVLIKLKIIRGTNPL